MKCIQVSKYFFLSLIIHTAVPVGWHGDMVPEGSIRPFPLIINNFFKPQYFPHTRFTFTNRSAHDHIEAFILSYDEVTHILVGMYCQVSANRQYAGMLL